jgi:starch synthase
MKVAFVSFDFGEYCIRLASGLGRYAEILLCLPDYEAEPYARLLSKTVTLKAFHKPRLRQPFAQLRMAARLCKWIVNFNPDVLHVQQGHAWFNLALPLLRRYPLVVTSHDPVTHIGDRTPQIMLDLGFRRADHIIVHVPQMRELVHERLGFTDRRVHVVPHILCGGDSASTTAQEDADTILFFGRISKYKGLEYLIRAEPLITSQIPTAKIVIAGAGDDFSVYRRMMTNAGNFVVHNGYVPDGKRAELFRRASIIVLPYTEATQSGVIPVAYSFGKPVVATAVGGLPAQVEDDRTGYLVPPRDPAALAEAIVRLLRDEQMRRQFGANGRRKLVLEASPDIVARKTTAVYRLVLSENATKTPLTKGDQVAVTTNTGVE